MASIFCIFPDQHILDTNLKARQKRGDLHNVQNVQLFSIDNQTESAFAAFFIGELMQRGCAPIFQGEQNRKTQFRIKGSGHLIIIVNIGSFSSVNTKYKERGSV